MLFFHPVPHCNSLTQTGSQGKSKRGKTEEKIKHKSQHWLCSIVSFSHRSAVCRSCQWITRSSTSAEATGWSWGPRSGSACPMARGRTWHSTADAVSPPRLMLHHPLSLLPPCYFCGGGFSASAASHAGAAAHSRPRAVWRGAVNQHELRICQVMVLQVVMWQKIYVHC